MDFEYVKFSGHAIRRMFERKISKSDVVEVLKNGEIIEEYMDDEPFPSYLMLGFIGVQPLHVVAAFDSESKTCHIITAYDPDPALWDEGFNRRRS